MTIGNAVRWACVAALIGLVIVLAATLSGLPRSMWLDTDPAVVFLGGLIFGIVLAILTLEGEG